MLRPCLLAPLLALPALAAQGQVPAPAPLPADVARTEALYQLTYQPDSTSPARRTEVLRLLIGSRLSRFESRNQLLKDSVSNALMAQFEQARARGEATPGISFAGLPTERMRTSQTAVIYKVPTARQMAVYDKLGGTAYAYDEPADLLTWTLLPATATLAGYACQQATTMLGGRRWEAWFTREVPLSEGPYKFYGLPGLIVKISDTRQAYSFELLRVRQLAAPVALAPLPAAQATTRAKFRQAKADYDRTGLSRMLGQGDTKVVVSNSNGTPTDPADLQRRVQANAKKRNNPLELR